MLWAVLGVVFCVGLYLGLTGPRPTLDRWIPLVLAAAFAVNSTVTLFESKHYPQPWRTRGRMSAVAMILLAVGFLTPSFKISLPLQAVALLIMLAAYRRIPRRLFGRT